MVLQIRVLAESPVADVTLERPRPVVHVHVRFEVAGRRERLGAQRALVRFLLRTHVKQTTVLSYCILTATIGRFTFSRRTARSSGRFIYVVIFLHFLIEFSTRT